jgi:hypothetical protein
MKIEPRFILPGEIPKLDFDSTRDLALPFDKGSVKVDSVRYIVGQPMGALSS